MKANTPSVSSAIKAIKTFRAENDQPLSARDRKTLEEILRRLQRLDSQCGQLINLNNNRMDQRGIHVEFDPSTDVVTVRHGKIEQKITLRRADPKVPISPRTLTAGGAYAAGAEDKEGTEPDADELAFEGLLEAYYYNAHRILKLVQSLPGFKNFECREITIVRNKLVEHPLKGEAYSFGFGATGPVVRPMHAPGREWIDRGLVPNTEAFVSRLVKAFGATGDPV